MTLKKRTALYLLPFLIFLISLVSVNQWNKYSFANTFIVWVIDLAVIFSVLWYKKRFFYTINSKDYWIVSVYFIWMSLGVIRGIFIAENYWEWKQLFSGTFSLCLPIFVYAFSIPWLLRNVLSFWFKYGLPVFFIFFIWILNKGVYQFYLGPVLTIACFLPVIKSKKWYWTILGLLLLMLLADFGARSQVIKAFVAIMMSIAYVFSKYITPKVLKIVFVSFLILPILFISLGLTGTLNIFAELNTNSGKFTETHVVDGQVTNEDLATDTRTFIYEEVINSAIKHDYVLWGRTPARGNDSKSFGADMAYTLKTGKFERHRNELCFPNVFTWLGLIGMLLYCFIYIKSAYLALYKSRSLFMKLVGVFIAFRFAYGWVEDINSFDILSISLWMLIAMGFSKTFRNYSDMEFKYWVNSIFNKQKKHY